MQELYNQHSKCRLEQNIHLLYVRFSKSLERVVGNWGRRILLTKLLVVPRIIGSLDNSFGIFDYLFKGNVSYPTCNLIQRLLWRKKLTYYWTDSAASLTLNTHSTQWSLALNLEGWIIWNIKNTFEMMGNWKDQTHWINELSFFCLQKAAAQASGLKPRTTATVVSCSLRRTAVKIESTI